MVRSKVRFHDSLIIKAPFHQGEAFSFCTVSSAGAASHSCHPDIYKTAF